MLISPLSKDNKCGSHSEHLVQHQVLGPIAVSVIGSGDKELTIGCANKTELCGDFVAVNASRFNRVQKKATAAQQPETADDKASRRFTNIGCHLNIKQCQSRLSSLIGRCATLFTLTWPRFAHTVPRLYEPKIDHEGRL